MQDEIAIHLTNGENVFLKSIARAEGEGCNYMSHKVLSPSYVLDFTCFMHRKRTFDSLSM